MPLFRLLARCIVHVAGIGCAVFAATPLSARDGQTENPSAGAVQQFSPVLAVDPAPGLFVEGENALRDGDLTAALDRFDRAAVLNSREWSCRAELMAIRLLAQKGDIAAATSRLDIFIRRPEASSYRYRSDALRLWLLAKSGNLPQFMQLWQHFQQTHCAMPDAEIVAALEMVETQLAGTKKFEVLADLLAQSLNYQTSDAARLAVLRREFDLRRDSASIVAVADRCARWFPDTEETAKIQLHAADRLQQAKRFVEAQKLWEEIAGNRAYPAAVRELAVESAAIAAEKNGNDAVARTMYQSLIAMTNGSFSARLKFGIYLLRRNDDPEAEKIFRELWLGNDERREISGAYLLRVLIKMKKAEDALAVAEHLRDSATYGRYAEIKLAELQEEKGELSAARKAYQTLAERYPDDPLISHVAYRIAFLADALHLSDAIDELVNFAKKYPADQKAVRALLLAMRTAGNAAAAKPYFDEIAAKYPQDPLFPAAAQQQFYFEMAMRHYPDALALCEKYPAAFPDAEFGAAAGLAKQHILFAVERWDEALALGKFLMERYPGSASAAEIALGCGNIESTIGNYQEALGDYERALKLRPAGPIGECAKGRIADMCYMLFAQTQQAGFLECAEKNYRELAEKSLSPPVRLEAFCRLGRTLELSGRFAESVIAYDKALFCALEMKAGNCPVEAIWCYRAAYGAIRIRMRSSRRIDREAALHAVDALESLQLGDYGEDFTALRRSINQKRTSNKKR